MSPLTGGGSGTLLSPSAGRSLFDLTLLLSRIIQPTIDGTATGGSTTTLVDTARSEPDEHFSLGTVWFRSGNNANKSVVISDHDLATTTLTFATQSGACAAGNLYSVAAADYPRSELMWAINLALREIGPIAEQDVSLVSVADQEEYTLPAGIAKLLRVEYATDDELPYNWEIHQGWSPEAVFEGVLRFLPGRCLQWDGLPIRLTYLPHDVTDLVLDADTIDVSINPLMLVWSAAVYAHRARLVRDRGQSEFITTLLNEAIARSQDYRRRFPVPIPQRDTILGG